MKQSQKTLLTIAIPAILIIGGLILLSKTNGGNTGKENVAFAQCLTEHGVKFYGAYWCPHCQAQKKLIGTEAMKEIDYVECAIPGNQSQQTQVCVDANIESYPTWEFANGSRQTGEMTFAQLADKTDCELPPASK